MTKFKRLMRGSTGARLNLVSDMAKTDNIIDAADKARGELREQLGGDGASVALALALGRLCAEAGIDVADVVGVVEVAHRESKLELARGQAAA